MDIIITNKGVIKLCVGGYMYTKKNTTLNQLRWICARRCLFSCKGAISTDRGITVTMNPKEHSHEPDEAEVEMTKQKYQQEIKNESFPIQMEAMLDITDVEQSVSGGGGQPNTIGGHPWRLEPDQKKPFSLMGEMFVYGLISLSFVVMSVLTFIVETHPAFKVPGTRDILGRSHQGITIVPNISHSMDQQEAMIPHPALTVIDIACLIFFTLEFVLRLTCAPHRMRFFFSFFNMVDLVALLPDYIEIIVMNHVHNDSVSSIMHYITILRLIRILRTFRLIRHVSGLWVMMYTLKASLEELMLMSVFLMVGMVIFASLIFFVGEEQFDTIPISLWWALITMTTVGYGDMYPTKDLGYVVGTFCALAGLLMIGFTVPIIVNHFVLFYTHLQSAIRAEKRQRIDLKEKEEELKLFEAQEDSKNTKINAKREKTNCDKEIEARGDAPPSYARVWGTLQNGVGKYPATDATNASGDANDHTNIGGSLFQQNEKICKEKAGNNYEREQHDNEFVHLLRHDARKDEFRTSNV